MLEIGQVITLRIRFNNSGSISIKKHPYLIVDINELFNYVEVVQIDSLAGKEYKAAFRSNKVILSTNPDEAVIDKDSFVQLDNKFTIECYAELVKYRRQVDKLSIGKLQKVVEAYKKYHANHHIDENKIVYMDREEIEELNN